MPATRLKTAITLIAKLDCSIFGMHGQAVRRQWTDLQLSFKQYGRKADGVLITPLDASSRNKDSYDITAISS